MPADKYDEMAGALTETLFTNGSGDKADRLVLTAGTRDLGGWCRGAVTDRIAALVRREVEAAAVVCDERALMWAKKRDEEEYDAAKWMYDVMAGEAVDCAAAIRARGGANTKEKNDADLG